MIMIWRFLTLWILWIFCMLTPKQRKQAVCKHHSYMSSDWCLTEPTTELKLSLNGKHTAETNVRSADLQTARAPLVTP